MQTQEIRTTEWEEFTQRFTALFEETLISVEQLEVDGMRSSMATDLPLRRMTFEASGCNDIISLHLGKESEKEFALEIVEPIHVKLRDSRTGAKELQFQAENGTFFVIFHSGKIGDLLAGLT